MACGLLVQWLLPRLARTRNDRHPALAALAELGPAAQTEVGSHASIDRAMRDAFRKMRRFLMTVQKLSEDEAISLMSIAVDFGITQVVDGNWGVHGTVGKRLFAGRKQGGK